MTYVPAHPDIRRQLKARLLDMTPRGFELFAGDLLVFMGLQHIAVTRYIGDGGIDAYGEIRTAADVITVPTGIQVKRYRANIQRADIDRFIGALNGLYAHGIFMTTAGYAESARQKAERSIPRIAIVNGDHIIALMRQHRLGILLTMERRKR